MVRRIKRALKRQAANFREQITLAEARRAEILVRLENMPDPIRRHPAYGNVRELLGPRYAKAKIAQRFAVLQSAEWLINVLEALPFI
jgi:hypothetical protein